MPDYNSSGQGYNLVKLLKRLEDATSRLEDITIYQEGYVQSKYGIYDRNEKVDSSSGEQRDGSFNIRLDATPTKSIVSSKGANTYVSAFTDFIKEDVEVVVRLAEKIDRIVYDGLLLLQEGFEAECVFLRAAYLSNNPLMDFEAFSNATKPINAKVMAISELKDANRQSKYFPYLNAILEASSLFSWIATDNPASVIDDFKEAAQFWTNRILNEARGKDEVSVEWVKNFVSLFDKLKLYVKEYHMGGLSYNRDGIDFSDAYAQVTKNEPEENVEDSRRNPTGSKETGSGLFTPKKKANGAHPPPLPPASVFKVQELNEQKGGINEVFAELKKGTDITKKLKKVELKEQTHKNPSLRAFSSVPSSSGSHVLSSKSKKSDTSKSTKPPRKELIGNRWFVEHYVDSSDPIVIEGSKDESVFIGDIINSFIQIKGKVNAISITGTENCRLLVDSSISGVDFIKSKNFAIQVENVLPQITVDKCDTGVIYLSKDFMNTEIYSSSSTSLNVNIPTGNSGDFVEYPIPEQLKHSFSSNKGKLVSSVFEHMG